MHNELVSYIQSNHAADGVEVRAVGPKAVTLALPPELHDLGNLCGELECRFNARIDIEAAETPGIGPTATVWVMQDAESHEEELREHTDDQPREDFPPPQQDDPERPGKPAAREAWWKSGCKLGGAAAATLTAVAALVTIASHSTALWKHLEL
jgi:hypothetical protein